MPSSAITGGTGAMGASSPSALQAIELIELVAGQWHLSGRVAVWHIARPRIQRLVL